jgi:hypothetical protein
MLINVMHLPPILTLAMIPVLCSSSQVQMDLYLGSEEVNLSQQDAFVDQGGILKSSLLFIRR